MSKQIIISDPDDEMNHIYEDLTVQEPEEEVAVAGPKEDTLVACAGAIEQQEGSDINPSYMNNYD